MLFNRLSKQNLTHYIVIFTLVVFFMTIAVGGFVCRSYTLNLRREFYNSNHIAAEGIRSRHENELQIMKDISLQMSLSTENTRFLLEEDPVRASSLKKQLYQYEAVSQYFDDICYYYQKDNYIFNAKTSMSVNHFFNFAYLSDRNDDLLSRKRKNPDILPIHEMHGNLCNYYDVEENSAIYILPIAPDYDSILLFFVGQNHFDRFLAPQDERYNFIIKDGTVIASSGVCPFASDELLTVIGDAESQQDIRIDGEDYLLTVLPGSNSIVYACAQPLSLMSQSIRQEIIPALLVQSVLSIPAAVLLTCIWHTIRRRIAKINTVLQSENNSDTFGLDSIAAGVSTLLSEHSNMRESSIHYRKSAFVRSFIQNGSKDKDELRSDALACGIRPAAGYMVAVCGSHNDSNEDGLYRSIDSYIENSSSVSGYGITLVHTNQRVILLFAENEARLTEAFTDILNLGRENDGEFLVALSWYHTDFSLGSEAYLEADTAYAGRFLADNDSPISFPKIGQNESISAYESIPRDFLTRFEQAIKSADPVEVDSAIDEICKRLRALSPSLLTFRLLFNEIFRIIAVNTHSESSELGNLYNVFTLSRCLTLNDFKVLIKESCRNALDESRSTKNAPELVNAAVLYMQQNFASSQLTMSQLADILGVSAVTLSVQFKNHMAISPSDYLTSLRMNHAKQLLLHTSKLVKDIAVQVGYDDEHVFMRRFKKYTGMTPGQYRISEKDL